MKTVHVNVNGENHVTFQCPFCERSLNISVSKFKNVKRELIIRRCTCSRHFRLLLDFRRFQRRNVLIVGEARNLSEQNGPWTVMAIMNISKSGLRFKILEPITMRMGDKIRVRFNLESPQDILIDEEVILRNSRNDEFGCEFMRFVNEADRRISYRPEVAA